MVATIKRYRALIILMILMMNHLLVSGQPTPSLEHIISITFSNTTPENVISSLGKLAGITFSYSPSILQGFAPVSGAIKDKPVREILEIAFHGGLQYKEKGNYLILTKAPIPIKQGSSSDSKPLNINGYVLNAATGERITEASVYDKNSLTSAITNQYGYFRIQIEKPQAGNVIAMSKNGFRDTVVTVPAGSPVFITIGLEPLIEKSKDLADTVIIGPDSLASTQTSTQKPERNVSQVNMDNIKDTLYRKYQVSFVPFVGTNQKMSGNVINDYSFNILGGYSLGTRKIELGGIFNIDRGNVNGMQLAGVFNTNGGSMKGWQVAGTANGNVGDFEGVQLGGVVNFNRGNAKGPQLAGATNINGKTGTGVEVAGVANIQGGNYYGPQIAGLLNLAMNDIHGVQVSGLINYGKNVYGSQIGFLNVADSVKGASIGFLSFVKSGYHKIELSADEIFYTNIAFRTGTHKFYNIVTAGMKPNEVDGMTFWSVGYGIGTAPKITRWFYLNFDLTSNQVNKGKWTPAVNLVNKLYAGVEFQAAKKLSLAAGVTLNGYVTDLSYDNYAPLFTDYTPRIINDHAYGNNINMKMWWGFKFGVRFL